MFGRKNTVETAPRGTAIEEGQIMNSEHEQNTEQSQGGAPYQAPPSAIPYTGSPAADINRRKSPVLATILSSFPGLGQVYVGYYQTGFLFMLVMAGVIFILNTSSGGFLAPFLGPFLAFFWIFNMIDANRRAQHYNRVLAGQGTEEIPEDFQMAGGRGSMPAGIALVIIGILIILDLNFNVSLEWLEDWWPLGLVGMGGWLIVKARQSK